MKNQYFGDVKDYLKYGLLRCLAASGLDLGIHWLLTRDDGGTDGSNRRYLERPDIWRAHDPRLFDFLQATRLKPSARNVASLETSGLLPARYFSEFVPDSEAGRTAVFERAGEQLSDVHLLFFDPDNGIEVRSVPYGTRSSSRYVYWRELEAAWQHGVSLLIYQHFPRQEHAAFEARIAEELTQHLPSSVVYTLATSDVVFLLAAQPSHLPNVDYALGLLNQSYGRLFTSRRVGDPEPVPDAPPALPRYRIEVVWNGEEGRWVASVPDLQYCSAVGNSPQEAVAEVMAALQQWIEVAYEKGIPLPEPSSGVTGSA